jgi:uncharacterized protein (DUF58 family)
MWDNLRRRMVRENHIFIMPSTRGTLFLGLVFVIIMVAATYNNNLIFILGFSLFAVFVVCMLQTHYNLKGVRIRFVSAEEGFEGHEIFLAFDLTQKRSRWKRALELRARSRQWKTVIADRQHLLPNEQSKPVRFAVLAHKRGVHPLPEIVLETYYPLGLFRAWKVFRPKGQLTVYPRPSGEIELQPRTLAAGLREQGMRAASEGDMGELRIYREGDSYHQIAWKHYARTGKLHSRVNWGGDERYYVIPWQPGKQELEEYLRQMSAWVERALFEQSQFEMHLPEGSVGMGHGQDHARACWRLLARVKGVG